MICPLCAASVELEAAACPACETDLVEYAAVYYRPDALFNEALRRLRRGQHAEASALLAQVVGLRPRDGEALALAGEAQLARGDAAEAVRLLFDVAELAPSAENDERYARALAAVEESGGAAAAVLADVAGRLHEDLGQLEGVLDDALERLAGAVGAARGAVLSLTAGAPAEVAP
jgi:predicted Zn-dependent protease